MSRVSSRNFPVLPCSNSLPNSIRAWKVRRSLSTFLTRPKSYNRRVFRLLRVIAVAHPLIMATLLVITLEDKKTRSLVSWKRIDRPSAIRSFSNNLSIIMPTQLGALLSSTTVYSTTNTVEMMVFEGLAIISPLVICRWMVLSKTFQHRIAQTWVCTTLESKSAMELTLSWKSVCIGHQESAWPLNNTIGRS